MTPIGRPFVVPPRSDFGARPLPLLIRSREMLVCAQKLHPNQVDTDWSLVRRLIVAQFPRWADLPVKQVDSGGTVNAIYRLGDDMCVRLPLLEQFVRPLVREARSLPRLAGHLPLAIPELLAQGVPAKGYPWPWSVYRWLEGVPWGVARPRDLRDAARTLATFLSALYRIDPTGGSRPRVATTLEAQDRGVRRAIEGAQGIVDAAAVTRVWEAALAAPAWGRPGVWVHSDLIPGNLLISAEAVTAVIDFGGVHVGDPAKDLMLAWTLLDDDSRDAFQAILPFDEATWARARGWAVRRVVAIPYYLETNPAMVSGARYAIEQVLADQCSGM